MLVQFPWPAPLSFLHLHIVNGPHVAVQVSVLGEHPAANRARYCPKDPLDSTPLIILVLFRGNQFLMTIWSTIVDLQIMEYLKIVVNQVLNHDQPRWSSRILH